MITHLSGYNVGVIGSDNTFHIILYLSKDFEEHSYVLSITFYKDK